MADRSLIDIVDEGEVLGRVAGAAASVPLPADQTAATVPFTPAGTVAATNVQAAIEEVAAEVSGGAIAVEDEGVEILASATRFDFTGAGVTVTDGGAGQANVAIPGGSGSFSGAIVSRSTSQSIPTGAFTALSFNTETVDTGAYHDNVTNPERLTVSATGYYLIVGNATIQPGTATATHRYIEIYQNGTTRIAIASVPPWAETGFEAAPAVSVVAALTAGDYVTVRLFQDTAGALNAITARAQIVRLG